MSIGNSRSSCPLRVSFDNPDPPIYAHTHTHAQRLFALTILRLAHLCCKLHRFAAARMTRSISVANCITSSQKCRHKGLSSGTHSLPRVKSIDFAGSWVNGAVLSAVLHQADLKIHAAVRNTSWRRKRTTPSAAMEVRAAC